MADPPDNSSGFLGGVNAVVAAAAAIVALIAAIIGAQNDWYGLKKTKQCSVSGHVTDALSRQPLAGVNVSYTDATDGSTLIATTGNDGNFSGSCQAAHDADLAQVRLFTVRNFSGGNLPCLHAHATATVIDTVGPHDGLSLLVPAGCS